MEEYRGYIRKVIRTFDSGDVLAEAEVESRAGMVDMIVVGPFNKFVRPGDWFTATGRTKINEFRGKKEHRFHARTIMPDLPRSEAGALALLDRTFNVPEHGVDLQARHNFVRRHGPDTAQKIEKNPDLLVEMTNDPARFTRALKIAWSRRVSSLEPLRILEKAGASHETCMAIIRKFKDETLDVLRRNPYELMTLRAVDFALADKIASGVGISADDPRRVSAGVTDIVAKSLADGNTYIPLAGIRAALEPFGIGWDAFKELAKTVGSKENAEKLGVTIFNSKVGKVVQRYETYRQERDVALRLTALVERGRGLDHKRIDAEAARVLAQEKYGFLSKEQREAVIRSSREAVAILTGGPGTGKSTVSDAIAEIAAATISGPLLLVAPTGKAARRLAETTKREATTVHKLLGAKGDMGEFAHDADNPLPAGCFVLVDEASMLDTSLTKSLLDALPPDGRILFVGDKDQLPSVDAGYVLGDMLGARAGNGNCIASSELTEVFRSKGADSMIAPLAKRIKEGSFDVSEIDHRLRGGVAFFEYARESIITQVEHLYCNLAEKALKLDAKKDMIILCPMRKGRGGTHEVNARLQAKANPSGAVIREWVKPSSPEWADEPVPRVGDRVMFTKNDNELGIRNGDVGILKRLGTDWKGRRNVPTIEVELDGGDMVSVPVSQASHCTVVAYAITGHKSQGSQYQCVVMPVSPDHVSMMERTLLYTEWTRAKRYVVLVGDKEVFQNGIENVSSSKRMTLLKSHIEEQLDLLAPDLRMKSPNHPNESVRARDAAGASTFSPPARPSFKPSFVSPFSK